METVAREPGVGHRDRERKKTAGGMKAGEREDSGGIKRERWQL